MSSVKDVLRLIPGVEVELVESGCCGMAGSFGYEAEHYETSMKMAELDLLPRVPGGGREYADRGGTGPVAARRSARVRTATPGT